MSEFVLNFAFGLDFWVYLFVFIFGLIIGSFLNCFIWRLRQNEGMLNRSYCPKCQKRIYWYDNIPLLSFVFLAGKCRHCKKAISWQYPLVELFTGVLFAFSYFINKPDIGKDIFMNLEILRLWFLVAVMVVIFVYDLRWYLILDKITIPAIIIVFFLNLLLGFGWINLLMSGILGGSFFLLQFLVSRGRWIGGGDIRLGFLMGVALGEWQYLVLALFLAYLIGSVIGLFLIFTGRREWGSKIPFGIFLSTATLIALFWGDFILNWYLGYLI